MGLDRGLGDAESAGDLVVGQSLRDSSQDLGLAFGQRVQPCIALRYGVLLDQAARDGWREQGHPFTCGADGGEQLMLWCVLEEEPGGAGLQRTEDVLVEVERRHHEYG